MLADDKLDGNGINGNGLVECKDHFIYFLVPVHSDRIYEMNAWKDN